MSLVADKLTLITNPSELRRGDGALQHGHTADEEHRDFVDQFSVDSSIYSELAKHQQTESWSWRDVMAVLQTFADHFNVEFKLDIPEVSLCLDRLDCHRYGHFRYGHNGFGLKGEIAINSRYLEGNRPFWEVLGTLLHELLHAWQQAHGTPGKGNHHNAEFRAKAQELGLLVDKRGVTGYAERSPFKDLLMTFGIETPSNASWPAVSPVRGQSKLKKWSCGCTNVRVAIADFQAQCLKCGQAFVLAK